MKITGEDGNLYNFEEVERFIYLGVTLTNSGEENSEISTRLLKSSRCVGSLYKLLKCKSVSRSAKVRIYETVIRPTVLYGCELWVYNRTNKKDSKCGRGKI